MRVAVTGASGYLGRNLISLYRDSFDFVALTRDAESIDIIEGIEYRESDYSRESLIGALSDCDAVVHLAYAMATKENESAGMEAYKSSIEISENIFSTALDLGITNCVFASSRLVYSNYSDKPFREDGPTGPLTSYGKSKVITEEFCEYLNARGAHIKVLRFGQIIGADMRVKGMFHIFMEKAKSNDTLTLIGSDVRDYIYVKDACNAIISALDCPEESGVFNISMGSGIDNKKMAEAIISEIGSYSKIVIADRDEIKPSDRIVLDVSKAKKRLNFSCDYDTINRIVKDIKRT